MQVTGWSFGEDIAQQRQQFHNVEVKDAVQGTPKIYQRPISELFFFLKLMDILI